MAINSKDIETLWQRYSAEGVSKGISVGRFFVTEGRSDYELIAQEVLG